jgi:DNA helicase II / ATP-dependent DNA helicase PcrA
VNLSSRQQQAVEAGDRALLIVAGPGTGKTCTLVHRIACLLQTQGLDPENILAVTFTRAAAREMRDRLQGLLPGGASRLTSLWVDTFHAVALKLLRRHEFPFGPGAEFQVADEDERQRLLAAVAGPGRAKRLSDEIRRSKQRLIRPSEGAAGAYQKELETRRFLDFDDVLLYACLLLAERRDLRERYRARFLHVLVDEFQDTSFAQYQLFHHLAGHNACAIGDPDQAIYGFAGNDFQPFEQFVRDFPQHATVSLSENRRSQAGIVEAAAQIIGRNAASLPRDLQAVLERGLPISVTAYGTARQEAAMIVRTIEGLLGGASGFTVESRWAEKEAETYAYGLEDIAILTRFHAQTRDLETALTRAGLPYQVFGKKTGEEHESRTEDLQDLQKREDAAPLGPGLRGNKISVMTLHRSKGLEFPVVFIPGCEDGVLPYAESRAEEERRLFYVGMTRAKSRLFLSYAKNRRLFGRTLGGRPSPFLLDMEEGLRCWTESRRPDRTRPARPEPPTLFKL